ncbi:competence protein ComG [Pullulanibacillus camelliae]|uniref:Competence protein ComG n=1 Tax=Pullulanibacillus camelliae TaxID=1707096 RepID=A0A8J2YIX6_9BACL|nr:competence type IV pilus major pilin ComGC [Pullulanibacillus camelliae]GGE46733.1 competence protein ComG [Pullulanibacillus camelliae]
MNILRKNEGFTLIEMMIVLSIISILLLIVIPNMTKSHEVASHKSCQTTVNLLQSQVAAYQADTGHLPETLEDLKEEGYVESVTCPGATLALNSDGEVVQAGSASH